MQILYNFSLFLVFVILVAGAVALIRPKVFKRFFGHHATRLKLVSLALLLIIGLSVVVSATEPASVKLARVTKEHQAQIIKNAAVAQKAKVTPTVQPKAEAATPAAKTQAEFAKEAADKVAADKTTKRNYWHKVVRVIDGDTVIASVDGKDESIRIIGMNSPEVSPAECYGTQAKAKATEFLGSKWIQLEVDDSQGARDKYGRLLAYVWFDNGTDFGRRMIEEGYAYEYTYDTPYAKQAEYKQTQSNSEAKKLGLWSPGTCDGKKTMPVAVTPPMPTPSPTPIVAPSPAPSSSGCDPNYTPCIPYIAGNTLNCPDIHVMVKIIGEDHNKFDADHNGYGCESYQ